MFHRMNEWMKKTNKYIQLHYFVVKVTSTFKEAEKFKEHYLAYILLQSIYLVKNEGNSILEKICNDAVMTSKFISNGKHKHLDDETYASV